MPDQESVDTESAVVTTYVPAYQKEKWENQAANLGMSQSEFVRTMVQAGRTVFKPTEDDDVILEDIGSPGLSERRISMIDADGEGRYDGSNPGGKLAETVFQTLKENGPLSWEELVEEVTGNLEDRLDDAIHELQTKNEITHSPRAGKYVLVGE